MGGPKIANDPLGFTQTTVSLSQSLYYAGWVLASVTVMPAAARHGRRTPMYVLLLVGLLATFFSTLATASWVYAAMIFVVGFSLPQAALLAYLLIMESLPDWWCPIVTVCLNVAFSMFISCMALVCKSTQYLDWRIETMLWYSPLALWLLIGPAFIAESPAFAQSTSPGAVAASCGPTC